MMKNPYKRKKQPELIRQSLLHHAARIATEQGLHAVTLQAVANAAGVTKGGLTHHFASKQELIEAIFYDLIQDLENLINQFISTDPEPYGAFTRAYIKATVNSADCTKDEPFCIKASLCALMIGDAHLRTLWGSWFNQQKKQHQATDSDQHLLLIQLAAEGLWLADISKLEIPDRSAVISRLIEATRLESAP